MAKVTKNVAFRVDASREIGTGHFMRCLALAASLERAGARCHFVCRHVLDHLRDLVSDAGYGFDLLGPTHGEGTGDLAHSAWLRTSQGIDADQTLRALSGRHWDWLVVDHYALDARWESAMRGAASDIVVIDDLADRHHACAALLDQNFYPNMDTRYLGKVPCHCRLLLGPGYAVLREEFSKLRASMRVREGTVNRILVLMGGVDADNHTEKAIQAIVQVQRRAFEVDVVVGKQHPSRDRLETMCQRHGFRYHVQTPNVAALMAAADLSIGAAGSSSWERCCLGLPAICFAQSAHQVALAEGLEARGAVVYLGNAADLSVEDLSMALSSLIGQPKRLASLSVASSGLVDGKGADRVCHRLLGCA